VIFYAWVPGERQKISDLSVIAESLRRQKDPEKYKDEAKALISMGVLYDNAQVISTLHSINQGSSSHSSIVINCNLNEPICIV
jgi:hypothetical protein